MHRLVRIQIFTLTAMVIFYSTYAFASSNSGSHPGGEGTATISGWNVSNVHYFLTDDSAKISAVEFDLDGPAEMVEISLDSSEPRLFDCENGSGTHWTCRIDSLINISSANELRVVATGNH